MRSALVEVFEEFKKKRLNGLGKETGFANPKAGSSRMIS